MLNHQQKMQMQLQEAAQYRKKYQQKKQAVDNLMLQL
jgi:hypothetical protein